MTTTAPPPERELSPYQKKFQEQIAEREAGEDERTRAIVEAAKARGERVPDTSVTVRFVPPESIRPAGWKPIEVMTGKSKPEKLQAILDLLERGPRSQVDIGKALGLKPAAPLCKELAESGKIVIVGETERGRAAGSPIYDLMEDAPLQEKVEPVKAECTNGEVSTPPAPGAPAEAVARDSTQEVEAEETPAAAAPADDDEAPQGQEEEQEMGLWPDRVCAADDCDETFSPTGPNQRYHTPRCAERQAARRKGVTPGLPEIECGLDTCNVRFTPTQPREKYHTDECRAEAQRKQKAASKQRSRGKAKETRADQSAKSTAAAAAKPPAEPGTPTELRQRYLGLLFTIAEEDPRDDILDRLERICSDGNGLRQRYVELLYVKERGDRLIALAEREGAEPVVLDFIEKLLRGEAA